jgi:hypothetical protein
MEEARAVLDRLDRIERLETSGAPAEDLLAEVRALLGEAERWARRERADVADAIADAEEALERTLVAPPTSGALVVEPSA